MRPGGEKTDDSDASDKNHDAYKEGCEHFKKGNFTRAKCAFEISLEYWPVDPEAWFALGNCQDELKNPAAAERCFRRSLQHASANFTSAVYFNLGNSLFDQGKLLEAIDAYSKVSGQCQSFGAARRNTSLIKRQIDSDKLD